MAQVRRMDCHVEAKSSADKFFDAYTTKPHLMPKMSNQLITDIKLLQGDWDSVGSVRQWYYALEGQSLTVKEVIEKIDDTNRTIVYKALEGDCLKFFKSLNYILNVTQMGDGCLVKCTMEFEMQKDDIPDPVMYADFLNTLIKNVDAFLLEN
ncbi:hypothetical protein V6N13_122159 [Hibiscus sabdariffa]|uniref:Bet v I/Major latex protein domain-containing protein n=2 Tax=Hibiscus sabdariffa TaxID=183260 RepID=A0ABR2AIW6_9ROSI